jgi:hypothetical protein
MTFKVNVIRPDDLLDLQIEGRKPANRQKY